MAIEIGMTSEEFWKDDPKLFSSYLKAFKSKLKRERDFVNYKCWLQGLYIYDGSNKALTSFGYGFLAGKKNPNKETYPSMPYDLDDSKESQELRKKNEVKKKNQKQLNFWASIKK